MYQLMNKDTVIATFDFGKSFNYDVVENLNIVGKLPYGCVADYFDIWLSGRYAAKHRQHLTRYLNGLHADTIQGFIDVTHSVSVNDTYWVKKSTEDLHWDDVSVFTNEFDEVIQNFAFDGVGVPDIRLSSTSPEFGTDGTYEKCWKHEEDGIYLYKRGTEGYSNAGLEPYSEVLASYVFSTFKAGISYELVDFRGKIASKCRLFNSDTVGFVPYAIGVGTMDNLPRILTFYQDNGWSDNIARMLICDAITFNTDRHFGNFGFLFDTETLELVKPAPAFDYNLALFPMEVNDAFADVNAFIPKYTPKLGDRFIPTAQAVLTPELRNELVNLSGFEYPDVSDDKFSYERVKWLTELSNQQIDKILGKDTKPEYVNVNTTCVSNIYKYRLKYNFMDEDAWRLEVPRLMQVLGIQHMSELEERIVDLV